MAKTYFTTSSLETKKAWDEKLFRDSVKETFFMSRFAGKDANSICQVKTNLEGKQGDKITFALRMRLAQAGITSGAQLEGNEEKLSTYTSSVSLEQYRHAVRDAGALDRQRAMFSIDDESRSALQDWMTEKLDQLCFDAIFASPSKVFYLNSSGVLTASVAATAKAGLHATNSLITPAMISAVKRWAQTGGNRAYVPMRPIKVNGKDCYVLLVHPDVLYDLRKDTTMAGALKDAAERGKDNPLFQNADLYWDGVYIYAHENCTPATDGGGASVAWAKGVLLGAQSLCWAWGERPQTVQKNFDYENEHGYAISAIAGVATPTFNSLTYGSVGFYTSRTNISGL